MYSKKSDRRKPYKQNFRRVAIAAAATASAGAWLFTSTSNTAPAQVTIFNDTFGNGSTIAGTNTPTATSTSYYIASSKAQNATPTIMAGSLNFQMAATSSGIQELQAQFTTNPIVMTNSGDTINMEITFTPISGILTNANSSSADLAFGMFDSGGVAPSGTLETAGLQSTNTFSGGTEGWQGYAAQNFNAGSTDKLPTRPAQGGSPEEAAGNLQDLLFNGASSTTTYNDPGGTNLATSATPGANLNNGTAYTEDMSIELTAPDTYTLASNLYPGTTATGTAMFTIGATGVTGTNFYNGFDSLAMGWRENGSQVSDVIISDIDVTFTAGVAVPTSTWTDADNTGSWNDANNWSPTGIPSGAGTLVVFGATTNTQLITLDADQTAGSVVFTNGNGYTLSAGSSSTNSLILDNGGETATALVSSLSGSNVISAPIVLNSNGEFSSTNGSAALTISGTISSGAGDTTGITITGGGFVSLSGSDSYTGSTTITSGGTLKLHGANAIPATSAVVNNGLLSVQYGDILTPVQGPTVIGSITGNGTLQVGSNSNAYLQLAGSVQQATLSMMLTNTTAGLETALDMGGQNASFNTVVNGSVGLVVIGNSGAATSTLAISPGTSTFVNTFSGNIQDGINGSGGKVALTVGSGTLVLSGTNSYSGATTIASGADLQATTSSGALSPSSTIANSGTLDVETSTSSGRITGTGALMVGASSTAVLQLASSSGASTVGTISVNSGSSVDLTNNTLDINYSGSGNDPISTIQQYLSDGFHAGWSGGELMSSTVATLNAAHGHLYGIGYIDGALPPVNFSGTVPPSGVIEIQPTISGDATLSGAVSFYDFQVVLSNFGKANQSWDQGDFDYAATVDFFDFQDVLSNFGATSGALSSSELATLNNFAAEHGEAVVSSGAGLSLVSVPEPASMGLLAMGGLGLLRRKRRQK